MIEIEGVTLHPLKRIEVSNGNIYHAMKVTDEGYEGFGEVYFSQIEEGKVKGWKRHNRLTLNLVVPVGAIKFVIYDDREDSSTLGHFFEITLSPDFNYQRLTIAPRLWMAFVGVGKGLSMLMDLISEVHDPEESDRKDLTFIHYDFKIVEN